MRAIISIYKVFSLIITQISVNNDCVLWVVDIYTQGDKKTGQMWHLNTHYQYLLLCLWWCLKISLIPVKTMTTWHSCTQQSSITLTITINSLTHYETNIRYNISKNYVALTPPPPQCALHFVLPRFQGFASYIAIKQLLNFSEKTAFYQQDLANSLLFLATISAITSGNFEQQAKE